MATPIMKLIQQQLQVVNHTPNSIFFPTQAPDGTPIDVSAGYVMQTFNATPSQDSNGVLGQFDLSAVGTFTFGATGVTWTLNVAQSALQVYTQHSNYALSISNDAGATQTYIATGQLVFTDLFGNT